MMGRSVIAAGGVIDIWWVFAPETQENWRIGRSQGVLQRVLGHYGRDLTLVRDEGGKPRSAEPDGLSFNLSHSGNACVVGVTLNVEVGVDCEQVLAIEDHLSVADLVFSPRERAWLAALPPVDQERGFYETWTRKEAIVKAFGSGLAYPMAEFDAPASVPCAPIAVDVPGKGVWWVCSIEAPKGFAAACACRQPFRLRLRTDFDGQIL